MRFERLRTESGIAISAVLMILAALSMIAAAGKGDAALQWVQARNARDYADAVGLVETGLSKALATERFRLDSSESGRYCRTQSRCVQWTVRHVETTAVPPGLEQDADPQRALHFEVNAEARAGRHARAAAVLGFVMVASGSPTDPTAHEITVCGDQDGCPQDAAKPPVRRYWRETVE